MRFVLLLSGAALLTGCGYVGDPLPPALNIPVAVADLRAIQRGDKLILDFTAPALTTDEMGLTSISATEVRVGDDAVAVDSSKPGEPAHIELPVRPWVGREAAVRVVLTGPKGQQSGESNAVTLRIAESLPTPAAVKAEPHPEGVRVSWTVPDTRATRFHVRREPPGEATVTTQEYIDRAVEAGKEYKYSVISLNDSAESLPSPQVSVISRDIFPPAVPAGVNAIAGVNTIELSWDRNVEPDLKSYRLYRNDAVLAQDLEAPFFSDTQVMSGQRYRYAVTALDRAGNESGRSSVVEIAAP